MHLAAQKRLAKEFFLDGFQFPLWWYTRGINYAFQKCLDLVRRGNNELAPGVWLTNLFVPMYGQYDWQGRLISFFMRLVLLIFRGGALVLWVGVCMLLFFAWLVVPLFVAYYLFGSLWRLINVHL